MWAKIMNRYGGKKMGYVMIKTKDLIASPDFEHFLDKQNLHVEVSSYGASNTYNRLRLHDIYKISKDASSLFQFIMGKEIGLDLSTLMSYPSILEFALNEKGAENMFGSVYSARNFMRSFDKKHIKNTKVKEIINRQLIEVVEKCDPRYVSQCMSDFLSNSVDILTDENKSKIFKFVLDNKSKFGNNDKKGIYKMLPKYATSYDERIRFLATCHRSLPIATFNQVVSELPLKEKDGNVKNILNKNNKLSICKFKEEDKDNEKKRKALIRHLVKTPTSAKNMPFDITITHEDLKKVAPAMRFDFFEWYYNRMFYRIRNRVRWYRYYGLQKNDILKNHRIANLKIELIAPDKIRTLLFSVGMKKYEKVSKWMETYETFYDIMSGKQVDINELNEKWSSR